MGVERRGAWSDLAAARFRGAGPVGGAEPGRLGLGSWGVAGRGAWSGAAKALGAAEPGLRTEERGEAWGSESRGRGRVEAGRPRSRRRRVRTDTNQALAFTN